MKNLKVKNKNQLKIGAILSYINLFLGNIMGIIYTPIMLRILGQAEYGLYTLSNSLIGYLGVLNFGLGNAIVRYTARYRANNDKNREYNLNGMFLVVYSILGVIVFLIGIIFIKNSDNIFGKSLSLSELKTMKILLHIMVFNLAISFPFAIFDSIIIAYEKFIFQKVIGIIRTIINPIIMIPLLFIGYKSVAMTILSTIINICCIFFNIHYCFKVLKIKVKFDDFDFVLLKEISFYSFFIFLNIIIDKIYWNTDQFILGAIVGSSAVAVYSIGSTFNTYYMSFSTAISNVFLPKISVMVDKNSTNKELSDLFIKVGRIQCYILSFLLIGFILVGKDFIYLWAGKGYNLAFYITIIVMIPLTVPLIQNIGISILQAKNKHKFRSIVYLIIAILNIFLTIPLARWYGGVGAAISTGIAFFVGNIIIMNIYYHKKIGLDILTFWKEVCKIFFLAIIALISTSLLTSFVNTRTVLSIIVRATILTIIYVILIFKFGFNDYEKKLFINPLKKIYSKLRS